MKRALCPLNPSNALQGLGFKVYMFTWKGKGPLTEDPTRPHYRDKMQAGEAVASSTRRTGTYCNPQRFTQRGPETSQGGAQALKAWPPKSQQNLPSLLRQKREMEEKEGEFKRGEEHESSGRRPRS